MIDRVLVKASSASPKPTFSLTDKDLPEIKEWKVGDKYRILLEVEQVGADKDEFDKRLHARFRILKAHDYDEYEEEEDE